jgi:3-deoxy-D-manno-octulosonic acid kinase
MLATHTDGSTTLITADKDAEQFDCAFFDPNYLLSHGLVTGEKKGRATTYFFQHSRGQLVLRHYWRGGMIGKLLSDQYLYLGLQHTRTYKEFALLVELLALGLPVPTPISAKVTVNGPIYRGDIITQALPNAYSLLDKLKIELLTDNDITLIAHTLAQFHNAGVNHADLNINNILFSDDKVYLIDFDRGTRNEFNHKTNESNMKRLKRSFEKEQGRNSTFYWQDEQWALLMDKYTVALHTG